LRTKSNLNESENKKVKKGTAKFLLLIHLLPVAAAATVATADVAVA